MTSAQITRPIDAMTSALASGQVAGGWAKARGFNIRRDGDRLHAFFSDVIVPRGHARDAAKSHMELAAWFRRFADAFSVLSPDRFNVWSFRPQRRPGRILDILRDGLSRLAPAPRPANGSDPLQAYEDHLLELAATFDNDPVQPHTISHEILPRDDHSWDRVEAVIVSGGGRILQFRSDLREPDRDDVRRLPPFPAEVRAWLADVKRLEARFDFRRGSAHERARLAARLAAPKHGR